MNRILNLIFFFVFTTLVSEAQTVGTLLNSEESFNGYTLFQGGPGPTGGGGPGGGGAGGNENVYLINNCGELVNSWSSNYVAGLSAKLMYDGSLVRGIRLEQINTIMQGGQGGGVEIFDWDGSVKWTFDYNENGEHLQHHDVMPLPNGNVIILAWENRPSAEAAALGRQDGSSMLSERIIEVTPNYSDGVSGSIVWAWYAFDHTVQNINPVLDNYGDLLEKNHRFNINIGDSDDWLHINAVEYIEEFDQLAISSRTWDEIFILDHSTSTEEAATGEGGNYGMGGDILYRWGKPANYNGAGPQTLNSNHGNTFSIFSNQGGGNESSTIVSWTPPLNADGTYSKEADGSYGPLLADLEYPVIYANTGSSCQGLPNGNLMYCANSINNGEIGEIDLQENLVWQYRIPLNANGALTQGFTGAVSRSFNAERYGADYPGLVGKDLSPGNPIELNPLVGACTIYMDGEVVVAPNAAFTTLTDDATVTFTDSSTGENITSWLWDFGDGNTSTEQNPVYTYDTSGLFNVCLTVTNAGGSTTICNEVNVVVNNTEIFLDLGINIFPNPVEDKLYIENAVGDFKIELLDISGQLLISEKNTSILDASLLPKGLYILNVITEAGAQTERIIVR